MLKAFCDRYGNEIPDYDKDKNTLLIVNGQGMAVESFDLCGTCGPTIDEQISDFIKGA